MIVWSVLLLATSVGLAVTVHCLPSLARGEPPRYWVAGTLLSSYLTLATLLFAVSQARA